MWILSLRLQLHPQVFLKPLQGEGQQGGERLLGLLRKRGHIEIFTYSRTDFLALSAWERWCQIHSFLCRSHAMTMDPKQDKEEMFKIRPPSSTISSSTAVQLWSCLVFSWIPSVSNPPAPSPPLCHFNGRIFTFNTNPKGGSASETRVQSIIQFSLMFF